MAAEQDPGTFWEQTPATYHAVMRGYGRRLQREQQAQRSAAWHGAYWQRVQRLPEHDKAVRIRRRPQRQSLAETAANVRAWRIALGGDA